MAVGFLTEQLGTNTKVRVRVAWGANINANSSTWTWTDVTSDVQQENGKVINISQIGKPPEANQTPPATIQFTLDNRANLYSKNNPLCSNWPNVRTYTPVQVQVTLDNGSNWWTMFQGEISEWKPAWDTTANYAVTIVTARGRMQRENQHKNPLRSAMERYISTASPAPVGYWPLDDGPNTLQAQSPIAGVGSAVRQYDDGFALPLPAWGTYTNTAPGAGQGANFQNGGTVTAPVIGGTASTTGWTVAFALNFGSTFQSTDFLVPVTFLTASGDYWYFTMNLGSPNDYEWHFHHLTATGSTDSDVMAGGTTWANTFYPFDDAEHLFVATAVQSGANINWTFKLYKDDTVLWTFSGSVAGQTLAAITNVSMGNDDTTTSFPWTLQHVGVWNGYNTISPDTLIFKLYGDRAINETPKDRMNRLCGEQGVEFYPVGFYDSTVAMGPQPTKSFMDNLRLCEVSDDGFMYDGLNAGISYQGVSQRNDQNTAITLAMTDLAKEFDPLDNDLNSLNQIRVDRDGGSSYTAERTTGILGTGADGIGVVDGSLTISNNKDDLLPHRANWETWKGTYPGFRYPVIYLDIAARPTIATKWINRSDGGTGPITPGSKMVITSPYSKRTQLPPEDLELSITGWAMRISRFVWQIDVQLENNHQYDVHKINDTSLGNIETSDSSVATAANASDTTLYVQSADESLWSTSAGDYNKSIYVDGIKCTVSAVANALRDTFTRTVSNGWGTPDTGPATTTTGGSASDYSTNGTQGIISIGTLNVERQVFYPVSFRDVDLQITNLVCSANVTGSGGGYTLSVYLRWVDASNFIQARIFIGVGTATPTLSLRQVVAGVETFIGFPGVSGVSGATTNLSWRLQAIGTQFRHKVWPSANAQPGTWNQTQTGLTMVSYGQFAVAASLATGATNTLPVTTTWDNFTMQNPQKFTISGLTKNVPADTDARPVPVHIWTPGALRY